MRKTKIVCTMGPACDDKETLKKMIAAGMDVARFNMSHGTYEEQKKRFNTVKTAIAESGKNVAILLDTKGPEVRVGIFENGFVELQEGQEFSLLKEGDKGNDKGVPLSYPKIVELFAADKDIKGREILLDDGKLSFVVKEANQDAIVCTVVKGGKLSNRKSINIPNYHINMPYVSAKDRADIEFGLEQGANVIAASFV